VVSVGYLEISKRDAVGYVERYRSGRVAPGVHDGYDAYSTTNEFDRLVDGDLLAPTLLGVPVDSPTFVNLKKVRQRLEVALAAIPGRVALADASDLHAIGRPFAVIDERLVKGARGTTLSKILHRKRPGLIPIYDQYVWAIYRSRTGSDRSRTWATFMTTLAAEMREDLRSARELWEQWEPETSALRALDMVVWQLGHDLAADK
jgi:hypothetical protein